MSVTEKPVYAEAANMAMRLRGVCRHTLTVGLDVYSGSMQDLDKINRLRELALAISPLRRTGSQETVDMLERLATSLEDAILPGVTKPGKKDEEQPTENGG